MASANAIRAATHLKNAVGARGGIYHREAESFDTQKTRNDSFKRFGVEERKRRQPRDKSRNEDKKMVRSQGFEPWTQ